MPYLELEDYLLEISELKRQLSGKLDILCGFEGEYIREDRSYYEYLLKKSTCDYLILGQHFFQTKQGGLVNVYQISETSQYEEYSDNVVEAMRTGCFRYIAHPDLIFLNDFPWDIHCDRACDVLINGSLKYDVPLEYNANGFRREAKKYADGERYPYPHDNLWDRIRNTEVKVYIGSDCHAPQQLFDEYVELAYRKLAEKGITVRTGMD